MDNALPKPDSFIAHIRRQWNDYRVAEVEFEKLEGLYWSTISGGVRAPAPQPFVHAYAWCNDIQGEFAHSGTHGECPHRIKVVLLKKDNKAIWPSVLDAAGPKPAR
jgi:hypothetical protein